MITQRALTEYVFERCRAWGSDVETVVFSRRRDMSEIINARKALCWLLRTEFRLSYPRIGKLVMRDHTTVIHHVRAFQSAFDAGEAWALELVPLDLEPVRAAS